MLGGLLSSPGVRSISVEVGLGVVYTFGFSLFGYSTLGSFLNVDAVSPQPPFPFSSLHRHTCSYFVLCSFLCSLLTFFLSYNQYISTVLPLLLGSRNMHPFCVDFHANFSRRIWLTITQPIGQHYSVLAQLKTSYIEFGSISTKFASHSIASRKNKWSHGISSHGISSHCLFIHNIRSKVQTKVLSPEVE